MSYSLWRNNVCLGQIVLRFPTNEPEGIAGMLNPTTAYNDISAIFQVRSPVLPGRPVQQFSQVDQTGGGRFPLRRANEEDLQGAPATAILELRDDHGEPIAVDMILIQQFEVGSAERDNEVWEACNALGIEPTGWAVFASKDQLAGPT
jgi:hypothetical protein